VLRDLSDAPPEVVAAERARLATEGWGARLLTLRGGDGQWAGGACFPADFRGDFSWGQPWTSTLPTLTLLRDLGIDPNARPVREAVALVDEDCRWEHAGQPFFAGEVEPCINGRTVRLGAYFDVAVEAIVARLLGEQLADGGWNCEAENGSVARLVRHDDLRARGVARARTGDRRFSLNPPSRLAVKAGRDARMPF